MSTMTVAIKSFDYEGLNNEIKRTMRRSAKDAVQLGYMLRRMMDEKLWEQEYACFDDYLSTELHMDYSMANRFININRKYSICGSSMEIAEKYEDYSQGLLMEMLSMPPELEEKVTPGMTVKQVREIKKQARKEKEPAKEEVIIDGEYREVNIATSQPEESPYGYAKSEYPPESMIASKGCGNKYDCFSCAQNCNIRQEKRYCVEAPMGNPFECTTMNVPPNLREDFPQECQFISDDLAFHRAGDNQPSPCCKNCQVSECGYRCRRAVSPGTKTQEENELSKLKQLLDGKKKELEEIMKVEEVPENIIFEKRTIVGALAAMVSDLEDMQEKPATQPELPVLKNNDQRKEWLSNYKAWGLWYHDNNIDVNYYKFDFKDGSRLIVSEYPKRHCYWNDDLKDETYYHLLEKDKKSYKKKYDEAFRHSADSETRLVDFLKNLQKNSNGSAGS